MRENTYAILCSIYMGVSGIFIFMGYDTQAFVVESILHSVYDRTPDMIGAFDGFYGFATMNAAYFVSNFFVASVLNYLRPKWLMVAGASFFTFYFSTFLYLNRFLYFTACGSLGLAFSAYNAGFAGYITEFSTRKTIARNQSLFWSFTSMSVFFAGVVYMIITKLSMSAEGAAKTYREYSDAEIRLLYGSVMTLALVAIIMLSCLPNRRIPGCIAEEHEQKREPFGKQMAAMVEGLGNRRIILLIPFYLYVGWFFALWIAIYPTSMQFTKQLAGDKLLPAYYAMTFVIGTIIMGLLTHFLSKRIKNFGMRPLLSIAVFVHLSIYAIVLASVPKEATHAHTDEPALLIQPRIWLCLLLAVLFGMADHANNTMRTVITSVVFPERRAQSFAISRIYHALAGSILFFASPMLNTYHYVGALSSLFILAAFLYWKVAGEIKIMEKAGLPKTSVTVPLNNKISSQEDSSI